MDSDGNSESKQRVERRVPLLQDHPAETVWEQQLCDSESDDGNCETVIVDAPSDATQGRVRESADSNSIDRYAVPEPRIKMEVLTPRQVNWVLISLWGTMIACAVLTANEQQWLHPKFTVETVNASCFNQFSGPVCVTWEGINCSTGVQQAASMHGRLSGVRPVNTFFSLRGKLFALNSSYLEPCHGLLTSNCTLEYHLLVYGRNRTTNISQSFHKVEEDHKAVVLSSIAMSVPLVCPEGEMSCEAADLFVERSPLQFAEYAFTLRDISLQGRSLCSSFGQGSTLELNVTFLPGDTVLIELVLRYSLLLLAVLGLLYWWRCLYIDRRTWADLLPEQRWISMVLAAVLLLQDPFAYPSLLYGGGYSLLSMVSYAVALASLLTFWLCMIHGLRHRPGERRGCNFLAPKLVFGFAFAGAIMAKLYCSSTHRITLPSFLPSVLKPHTSDMPLLDKWSEAGGWAVVPWGVLSWLWLVWFLLSMYKTSSQLHTLPYLHSRFRQLSFRFFLLQSFMMAFYLFSSFAASVLYSGSYFLISTIRFNAIPNALLLHVYVSLLAWIYLPVGTTQERALGMLYLPNLVRDKADTLQAARVVNVVALEEELQGEGEEVFCLEKALLACNMSWQAYYDEYEAAIEQEGPYIDVEPLGFTLHKRICHPALDIVAIICVEQQRPGPSLSRRKVVVAFRGSRSVTNALLDMDIRRVRIPSARLQPHHHQDQRTILMALQGLKDTLLHPVESLERGASTLLALCQGVRVHAGFWQAYDCISETLLAALSDPTLCPGQSPEFLLTGHSLGGCLSQLLALELRLRLGPAPPISVYTFGQPRTGNRSWAQMYQALIPTSFRAVLRNDVVSTIPGPPFYVHGGQEVIMDMGGNVHCNPSFVEKVFRPPRNSVGDHSLERYLFAVQTAFQYRSVPAPGDEVGLDGQGREEQLEQS